MPAAISLCLSSLEPWRAFVPSAVTPSPKVDCKMCASHHPLVIAEIAAHICDMLEGDKQSLFRLACCNKALSETALDSLWMKLDSMKPFMPLIPSVLSNVNDIDLSARDILQIPCPSAEEWETFDKYARRVKELRSADPRGAWVDGMRVVYGRLAAVRARGGSDLFPNLQYLVCFLAEPGLGQEKLLPSTLRSLTLFSWVTPSNDVDDFAVVLSQMARHTPSLEHLTLENSMSFHQEQTLHPIPFTRLRTLDLTRLTQSSQDFTQLCHVLSDTPVTQLSVHIRNRGLDDDWNPTQPAFPALQSLTFCGDPLLATKFLERLATTTLREFIIEHEDVLIRVEAYECLLKLLHSKFRASLTSLYLNLGRGPISVQSSEFLFRTLKAVLPIVEEGLEELRYSLCACVPSLPEPLQEALKPSAWPTLKVFEFTTQSKRLSDRLLQESMEMYTLKMTMNWLSSF
ncbi:hypothetical protein F5I97DRAFT_1439195 [Phlebopus sp. FC_14]|nr:hypothetical protein F5I97DRAFT_1439195 [Phlebopus sp. FC_14]